ncbi:MAG: winged helix-turn-helix domain-containing protein [Nevskia sp.]|nr:winged helix-turn-helix domain-containing protein [Nevskia sp.]
MTDQLHTAPSVTTDGARRRWHFARAVLDERSRELLVDGAEVQLERKPLEVLIYLIQHAGEVCTKDELLASIWPGRFLSETALAKCISRLREVLADADQGIIKTAHGFGYRFVAPVRVEYAAVPEPPKVDVHAGDHPHGRPHWTLLERLGVGGHGEAWRARHDKTHEQRVFKFALDEASLAALKREITLFRIINDTLGDDARVVKLLDWNLEHAPYFVEAEYIDGGSLPDWVQARGGCAAIPLEARLEVVARIADALASVHAVGVLHKDLKPSNVLIDTHGTDGEAVDIRLADFGSGGVLDAKQFEDLGITRLGFTRTAMTNDTTSGTLLYLAPEVAAGQPFTVKSDIYALGIILFHLLTGEFGKPMSPGWERGIADELLREDIAQAADGNPAARLSDASELARRLRSLEERRRQLAAERAARARAEQAERALERSRARRLGIAIAIAALLAGLVASTALYFDARRARDQAQAESRRAQGVSDFMSQDMLARITSGKNPVKDLTVRELLDSAAAEVDKRFAAQPDTAAAVHAALGRSYLALEIEDQALPQLQWALDFYEQRDGPAAETTLSLASEVLPLTYAMGTLRSSMDRYVKILKTGEAAYGDTDPRILPLRIEVGRAWVLLGQWTRGMDELKAVLGGGSESVQALDPYLRARGELMLGHVLDYLGEFPDAEHRLRQAVDDLSRLRGPGHISVSLAHLWLGRVLAERQQFAAAESEFGKAESIQHEWVDRTSGYNLSLRLFRAEMLIEEDDTGQAISALEGLVASYDAAGYPAAIDASWGFLEPLIRAYMRAGRLEDAARAAARALRSAETAIGADHPDTRRIRIESAEIAAARGRLAEARSLLAPNGRTLSLTDLPRNHPLQAELLRASALIRIADGDTGAAHEDLTEALRISELCYGAANWRTRRAQLDLSRIH